MAAEFKIGRLRYTWAGTWTPSTIYARDDVILNDGKAYSCLVPNTSSTNFYTDLYATFPCWQLILDGKTWTGPWVTNYSYGVGHIVVFGGKAYYSSTAHTSTTFAADAANWTVYAEFDGWQPAWTTATAYGVNTVVKYGGIVYKCTANHTSAASTSLGLEADQASWIVYYSGVEYKGIWASGIRFKLNDLVKVNGNIYICTQHHTSGSTFSVSFFSMYTPGQLFKLVWSNSTVYQIGDIVLYGGNAYISKTANNSNNFPNSSIANWSLFNIGYNVRNTWVSGSNYMPGDLVARNGVLYQATANSIAQDPNTSTLSINYVAIGSSGTRLNLSSNTNISPGITVSSESIFSGQTVSTVVKTSATATATITAPTAITISSFTSKIGTGPYIVTYAIPTQAIAPTTGVAYLVAGNSTANTNGSATCTASSTTSISLSYTIDPGIYGSGTTTITLANSNILTLSGTVTGTFEVGMLLSGTGVNSAYITSGSGNTWTVSTNQIVTSRTITGTNNYITLSRAPNAVIPDGQVLSFVGINSTYWSLLIPGKQWADRWSSLRTYAVGDIVSWANGTYVCINYQQSSATVSPNNDSRSTTWVLLISDDLNNSLNTLGDLRIFKDGAPSVLPITSPAGEIDTYVLAVGTDVPNWKRTNVIPAVFYVDAYSGIDSAHFGITWDQPWRTIKYACDFVNTGFYYPNAVTLLKANKAFMVTEMYQWMLYQMASNNSPFSQSSLWDVNYTLRDAERIIDAIVYDLKRGGNSQTVAATLSYFFVGTRDQFINSLTAASVVYYSPALNYLLSLMQSVVTNTIPAVNYQTFNEVPATSVVYQRIINNLTAETGVAANISSLMTIITTALTNQNTYLVPSSNTGLTATIYVKTGTYSEQLPIVIPENVSIVGDELRSAVVQPANNITLYCTQTISSGNQLTANTMVVSSTVGLEDQMPLQFISPPVNNAITSFGGITSGKTYYVVGSSITNTSLRLKDGPTFTFTGSTIIGSNIISNVTSITNLAMGMSITGTNIPDNTYVYSFSQTVNGIATVTLCTGYPLAAQYVFVASNATAAGILQTFTAAGNLVQFTNGSGSMLVFAGECLKNMFLMRNGTTIRNLSLFGLKGTVTGDNEYATARPTGPAYTSLDPGNGPNDTSAWIIRKSPYAQNLTVFGDGATGIKIDGTLHNGGSKSIVSNDYTMVISDGIGIWCTGPGAITEAISVFSYYCYAGYFAEAGGRIRSANGNSSYGTFGVVSEGYDLTEAPLTGKVNNQSQQVQAEVTSAFGTTDQLLKLNYTNAGSGYYFPVTNMLKYSNDFLTSWTNDANLSFIKNNTAPSGYTEAWLLTGSTGTAGSGYIQQSVLINPAGYTYININGATQDGAPGNGAAFDITVTPTAYTVSVRTAGSLYQTGNSILIKGSVLGGIDDTNDLTIVVGNLSGTGVASISASTGTVPTGSNQKYTLSMYIFAGTSASVDIQAVFSGTTTVTSGINYNVSSHTVTPYSGTSLTSSANGGSLPTEYGAQKTLVDGWYRVWFAISDLAGVNNTLTYKLFPQGTNAPIANTYSIIYGAQLEMSGDTKSPKFYLETTSNRFTAHANYQVVGAGANASLSGDEPRSQAIFNARITADNNGFVGGAGYATSLNTAQDGGTYSIKLASTDQGIYNYLGMRIFINSGTGAGQYGFISYYNNASGTDENGIVTKTALVLKESFESLSITTSTYNATAALNTLTLATNSDVSSWYVNQAVQFIPTYYTTTATATSVDTVVATATAGGTINTISIPTASLALNMPVTFTGSDFNITAGYQYYITTIDYVNNAIQISTTLSGNPIDLNNVASGSMTMSYPRYSGHIKAPTANMVPNIPIQFTGVSLGGVVLGTNYYINDIIDANNFTISTNLVSLTSTVSVGGSTNTIGASNAQSSLVPMNPIVFSGTIFDSAVSPGVTYYISNIVDSSTFNIATSIIRTTVTNTEFSTNLVTVNDVTGFVVGQPIIFSGIRAGQTFGNISPEVVYYILTINAVTDKITISSDKTNPFILTNKSGLIQVRTCPEPLSLGGGTGSMTLTSTGTRLVVTNSIGNFSTMNGTFSTSLFGGVNSYTRYYITSLTEESEPKVTVSTTPAGTPITLSTGVGNMRMAASGWDNITPGTQPVTSLDSTSAYFIEPRVVVSSPPYSQASGTVASPLTGGASFTSIAYGGNYFMAIPTSGTTGALSSDGLTWSPIKLPTGITAWINIAYGNNYWLVLGTTSAGNSIVAYSNSNGLGWRTSSLPSSSTWIKITYGNGVFVAVSSDNTRTVYSNDHGKTWTASSLPSSTPVTLTGTPIISTDQFRFGASSLYLNGSSYVTFDSDEKFAYNREDFTIEFFWRPTAIGTQQVLIDQRNTSNDVAIYLEMNASGNIRLFVSGSYRITSSVACSAGTWNHVALSRASGVTRLFVNGTLTPTTYTDANTYSARPIRIGTSFTGTLSATGYIDEVRVSRGVSRYSTTFTSTFFAFSTDANTMLLMHLDNVNGSTAITSSIGSWVGLTYGSGIFLTVNSNGQSAWSVDGISWVLSSLPTSIVILSSVTILGSAGQFQCTTSTTAQLVIGQSVVISGVLTTAGGEGAVTNGTYYISATNGKSTFTLATTYINAIQGTNPITTSSGSTTGLTFAVGGPNYTSVSFGNNKFVAVQSGSGLPSAVSFDGANWTQSLNYMAASKIKYGQGVFVAINASNTTAWVSEHGISWTKRTLTYGSINSIEFGMTSSNIGVFATLTGDGGSSGNATGIYEGSIAQGRASTTSGVVDSLALWETGSNYSLQSGPTPTVDLIDYNVSVSAVLTPRVGNGALANPTFINRGTGYNTTSTVVRITGDGYADTFQTGLNLIVKNLASVPLVGSNLSISGDTRVYKVTSASAVFGTTAPFIEATMQISPEMTTAKSPSHETTIELRQLYSQCRVTNHDFLLVGTGNKATANYPYTDITTAKIQNQAIETNQGHVFYSSTDENGNFSVGGLFGVQQATGTVTLSATQFGLTGLETLSLGGIAVGNSSVVVSQFSTDPTFAANSDAVIPTQRAVKSFLTGRLSQGGANTYTGNFIAGTVSVGGPNYMKSTVIPGLPGSDIKMLNKVYITGSKVDGNMAALDMFIRCATKRGL